MRIKLYSKSNCPQCKSAKSWLSQRNFKYEEVSLDDPEKRKTFLSENPDIRSVPQIFLESDNEKIHFGSFTDLVQKGDILDKYVS